MKLNWAERWVVNNPTRVWQQGWETGWMRKKQATSPESVILELGCGRGAGARHILKRFDLQHLHIQDLDPVMIEKAKKYLTEAEKRRISFHVGDAADLEFEDASFDAVFGFGVIHHVPDWRAALSEVARVLKPGGIYFIEELYPALYQNFITKHILAHPERNRFKSHQLHAALGELGFAFKAKREVKWAWLIGVATKTAEVDSASEENATQRG